jgi:23S rRNA pseudouridine2605 synthase
VRLAKYLAHSGVASRRAAERLIAEGRVRVGGEVVLEPAHDVDEASGVSVDGEAVRPEPRVVYVLNKPSGVVSTARDTHGRPTVVDLVPAGRRLYPVGRLDAETTGLILVTNDGELANVLTHPRYEVEKRYRARLSSALSDAQIETLRSGIELEDGVTLPARVKRLRPGLIEISIREGRNRQVRRMVEALGSEVVDLQRIAFGPLQLGDLKPGRYRRLTAAEVERLRSPA